jgi:uncharacterized membrane protein YsdA (DUF1294 family)
LVLGLLGGRVGDQRARGQRRHQTNFVRFHNVSLLSVVTAPS